MNSLHLESMNYCTTILTIMILVSLIALIWYSDMDLTTPGYHMALPLMFTGSVCCLCCKWIDGLLLLNSGPVSWGIKWKIKIK